MDFESKVRQFADNIRTKLQKKHKIDKKYKNFFNNDSMVKVVDRYIMLSCGNIDAKIEEVKKNIPDDQLKAIIEIALMEFAEID